MSMVARSDPGHRALSIGDRKKGAKVMGLNFSTEKVQTYYDSWRETDRECRYRGRCRGCGRRTYAFDDGENDPRGPLGDHAYWPVESERTGAEVVACALCANDYAAYQLLTTL